RLDRGDARVCHRILSPPGTRDTIVALPNSCPEGEAIAAVVGGRGHEVLARLAGCRVPITKRDRRQVKGVVDDVAYGSRRVEDVEGCRAIAAGQAIGDQAIVDVGLNVRQGST